MRFEKAIQSPDNYLQHHLGYTLSELMAPIGENHVGDSVRNNGVYFNIKKARDADDPSLPMGVWTHDLKTADWQEVKQLALSSLAEKSKDLQLVVWLFEANIHLDGFAGVAPAAFLIQSLCQQYWDDMYPIMEDSDIEYRTNPLNWLNDKLTAILQRLPLTSSQLDGAEYCWNDWIKAQHNEKLKKQQQLPDNWHGLTPQIFKQRLVATQSEKLMQTYSINEDGLSAMKELQSWLDQCCGNDSPNLNDIITVLNDINVMFSGELQRRGINVAAENMHMAGGQASENSAEQGGNIPESAGGGDGGNFSSNGTIKDRTEAFVLLRKAAEFLMNDDPHSPVPYLVQTACEWGAQTAPDLYQELFLVNGGQLNIFELMGLEVDKS